MKLKKVHYKEFPNDLTKNYWELSDLVLADINLVVGKNATGKTRTINLILNLAREIIGQIGLKNGEWETEFLTPDNKKFTYELIINDGKVIKEKIVFDNAVKLLREKSKTTIKSDTNGDLPIEPPDDKLVLHIRRDKKEHPFLEYLYEWAVNTNGYYFGKYVPSSIEIPGSPKSLLQSLDTFPSVFEKLNDLSVKEVIKNMNEIGYEIENANLQIATGLPINLKLVYIKEKGLKHSILQTELSSGMIRAFALLVIIQYLLSENRDENSTILIDDFGEGLDFDRATKLAEIIFQKMAKKNIQFITTTNDRFLMNTVDIENWNVLNREYDKVKALNYDNSKKLFDEFKITGLSNFDLFSSDYLSSKKGIK